MGAMTKFELSHAYPFMALNFVIVLALSAWLFNEPMSVTRMAGVALICIGTIVAAQG
jgi:multidrug transporter EmrE-like cation transporter